MIIRTDDRNMNDKKEQNLAVIDPYSELST